MKKFLKFLGSPLFIGCGAVVLALLLYANWKQVETARGIKAKIGSLSDQANSLQQKSSDLLSTINSLKQAGATEKLAREQLNLKEPGEFVYSFAPQETGGGAAGAGGSGGQATTGGDTTPNPEKWYNYFFRGGS
jgi:cell division protein FtsB